MSKLTAILAIVILIGTVSFSHATVYPLNIQNINTTLAQTVQSDFGKTITGASYDNIKKIVLLYSNSATPFAQIQQTRLGAAPRGYLIGIYSGGAVFALPGAPIVSI